MNKRGTNREREQAGNKQGPKKTATSLQIPIDLCHGTVHIVFTGADEHRAGATTMAQALNFGDKVSYIVREFNNEYDVIQTGFVLEVFPNLFGSLMAHLRLDSMETPANVRHSTVAVSLLSRN